MERVADGSVSRRTLRSRQTVASSSLSATARIRSVRDGSLSEPAPVSERRETGERLLAIAVDPEFARTRFVFAITVAGGGTFSLDSCPRSRRTRSGTAPCCSAASGAGIGPGGLASLRSRTASSTRRSTMEGRRALSGDLASPNGKILRLNADGTTPDDQAGASPIYAAGSRVAARVSTGSPDRGAVDRG